VRKLEISLQKAPHVPDVRKKTHHQTQLKKQHERNVNEDTNMKKLI
jgi:hypothetical protein